MGDGLTPVPVYKSSGDRDGVIHNGAALTNQHNTIRCDMQPYSHLPSMNKVSGQYLSLYTTGALCMSDSKSLCNTFYVSAHPLSVVADTHVPQ